MIYPYVSKSIVNVVSSTTRTYSQGLLLRGSHNSSPRLTRYFNCLYAVEDYIPLVYVAMWIVYHRHPN